MIFLTWISMFAFSSNPAFAYPKVGDKAVFHEVEYNGADKVELKMIRELVDFDAVKNQFKEKTTVISADGAQHVEENWDTKDNYPTRAAIQYILTSCEDERGGKIEKVTTPAGNFTTCKMKTDNGQSLVWIADVPFGLLKSTYHFSDQIFVESELESFVEGK